MNNIGTAAIAASRFSSEVCAALSAATTATETSPSYEREEEAQARPPESVIDCGGSTSHSVIMTELKSVPKDGKPLAKKTKFTKNKKKPFPASMLPFAAAAVVSVSACCHRAR